MFLIKNRIYSSMRHVRIVFSEQQLGTADHELQRMFHNVIRQ
jgi:hypothetical protein